MPTFRANLKAIKFDSNRWLKQFELKMKRQNQLAAGEWLRAVLTRVPVRTGMAQGSLLPLGRFLSISHAGEMFEITPIQEPDRIAQGEALSDDPKSMFVSNGKGEFLFIFDINVFHYTLNEFFPMGPYVNPADPNIQPPWNSMVAGRDAYLNYIQENVPTSVPRVAEFLYATRINSNG